jgi:hypothetical protein
MGATKKGDGDTVRTRIIAPAEGLPGLPPPSDSSSGSSSGSLSDSELSDRYVFSVTSWSSNPWEETLKRRLETSGQGPLVLWSLEC